MAESIIPQLYQRKMFRITAGYLAVAWVLWQVVGTTCPAFECSNAFQQSIFWLLIAGLPITMAIAWVNWKTAIVAAIGMLAGLSIMFFVMRGPATDDDRVDTSPVAVAPVAVEPAATLDEKSIAVLAFVNMSADPEQEYFSDGISEEILNGLAKVDALRVAARTSSFYFKDKDTDLQTIAEKLRVNHVLEGSVRKAGNRLRITAQLIKADDGFHLWSETYDQELTDIFAVQDEIARAVVDALKIELGIAAGSSLVDIGTSNREAYDWYLRGKDAVFSGTAEGLQRGIEYFQHAIALDPQYTDAYAYLGYAHIQQHPFSPYGQLAPAIKQAYSTALKFQPAHRASLCVQGYDKIYSDWDWPQAGHVFRAGTPGGKVNDICLGTYIWWFLPALGRYDEGIALLRAAESADPLNLGIKFQLGIYLGLFKGEPNEAIRHFRAVLDAAPDHLTALINVAQTYLNAGQLEEAEAAIERVESLESVNAYPYAVMFRVELEVFRDARDKAQSAYEQGLRVAETSDNQSPDLLVVLGIAAAFLGHLDESISLLNRGFDDGAWSISWVRSFLMSWPAFTEGSGPALMAHPDFQALLAKMNLDDASIAALQAAEAQR